MDQYRIDDASKAIKDAVKEGVGKPAGKVQNAIGGIRTRCGNRNELWLAVVVERTAAALVIDAGRAIKQENRNAICVGARRRAPLLAMHG